MKKTMVVISGFPFFAKRVAHALKNRGIHAKYIKVGRSRIKSNNNYSLVHFIGSPTVTRNIIKFIPYKLLGKKVVVSWIGYDVRLCKYNFFRRIMAKVGNSIVDQNLAVSRNLVEDLREIGITAIYQPLPVYSIYKIRSLPEENRVAVYLPTSISSDDSWKFYQGDIIKKLVKDFNDVEFIILKNDGSNFGEKNVTCLAWVKDMERIYQQVKAVIRLPLEDGTSGTIIETLSMGRNMIASNTLLPFCKIVNSYMEARSALKNILEKSKLNVEGSEYVHKNFTSSKLADDLIKIYNSLI